MKLLEGKVALVTGASRGIGRAIALRLAEQGAKVVFTYRSSQGAAEKLGEELSEFCYEYEGIQSDAANFADAHAVVEKVLEDFGQIDILINNAGQTKDGLIMRMSEEQWDSIIDNNLKSAFNFTHAVVPSMARRRTGSIINISSVVGVNGNAGQCNYAASKAALLGLTKSIAKEMGPRGIRCNAIAPGFIATDMTDKLSEELRTKLVETIPLRRGGTPEDVANVALFLASDLASYVNGQTIHCCGGMSC